MSESKGEGERDNYPLVKVIHTGTRMTLGLKFTFTFLFGWYLQLAGRKLPAGPFEKDMMTLNMVRV